jgi:glucosamine--fructose-6-phosphate aminotransferase (isomerizing)
MLGLFVAAIAIGERLGHLDAAASATLVKELHATAVAMAKADDTVKALTEKIAETFTPDRNTVILGGGPNYATAYFGMAKWFEGLTRPAHLSQLEEWAHEHYFMTSEKTDTIILLPPGKGYDRGLEQAEAAREMGSRVIIIGEEADQAAQAASDVYFAMPGGLSESVTPFVYKLPFEYLSCHIASQQKIAFLGFDNKRRQEINFRQIFNSAEKKSA